MGGADHPDTGAGLGHQAALAALPIGSAVIQYEPPGSASTGPLRTNVASVVAGAFRADSGRLGA